MIRVSLMPMCCTRCDEGYAADKKFCGLCGKPTERADCSDFDTRCALLAELFIDYREDERFAGLITGHDLGFPLAYSFHNGFIDSEDGIKKFVDETWEAFLLSVGETYDRGFGSYDSVAQLIGDE